MERETETVRLRLRTRHQTGPPETEVVREPETEVGGPVAVTRGAPVTVPVRHTVAVLDGVRRRVAPEHRVERPGATGRVGTDLDGPGGAPDEVTGRRDAVRNTRHAPLVEEVVGQPVAPGHARVDDAPGEFGATVPAGRLRSGRVLPVVARSAEIADDRRAEVVGGRPDTDRAGEDGLGDVSGDEKAAEVGLKGRVGAVDVHRVGPGRRPPRSRRRHDLRPPPPRSCLRPALGPGGGGR